MCTRYLYDSMYDNIQKLQQESGGLLQPNIMLPIAIVATRRKTRPSHIPIFCSLRRRTLLDLQRMLYYCRCCCPLHLVHCFTDFQHWENTVLKLSAL